jgi:hypothetical protein
VEADFWGTMVKAVDAGVTYMYITEHQLLPDVYYLGQDGKPRTLPPKDQWELLNQGIRRFCRIPAGKLVSVKAAKSVTVMAPQIGEGFVVLYIGVDPKTVQNTITATQYKWSGDMNDDVVHSATTENFSCGSWLFDVTKQGMIGLHHGSLGPAPKTGNNNLCAALKAGESRV